MKNKLFVDDGGYQDESGGVEDEYYRDPHEDDDTD